MEADHLRGGLGCGRGIIVCTLLVYSAYTLIVASAAKAGGGMRVAAGREGERHKHGVRYCCLPVFEDPLL